MAEKQLRGLSMVEHDLVIMAVEEKWPELRHGRDFLVAHPLCKVTGKQSGNPFILQWSAEQIAQPNVTDFYERAEELRPAYAAQRAKSRRDALLAQSDWTQMGHVPLETREMWEVYRQALRDVTEQEGFPFEIAWPVRPGDEGLTT
ncbi:phage tail assembly chaperone [Burkholderia sp. JSH-S8]|nr:phage tail assembly chaperone [Burkholderia sp. JSH-S8]